MKIYVKINSYTFLKWRSKKPQNPFKNNLITPIITTNWKVSSEDLLMDKLQFYYNFVKYREFEKFYRKIWIIHDSRQEIYHPSRWPDPLTHGISKFKFLKWYFRKDTDWLFEAFGTWINSQEVLWKFNWDTRLKIIVNQTVLYELY